VVHKNGYKLAHKNSNGLQQLLSTTNTRLDQDEYSNSGVYKLKCNDCEHTYIGQTGRSLRERFKEHIPNSKNTKNKSKFSDHIIDEQHSYTDIQTNMKILHKIKKGPKMNIWEEFEIYRHHKPGNSLLLNNKLEFTSHGIYDLMNQLRQRSLQ